MHITYFPASNGSAFPLARDIRMKRAVSDLSISPTRSGQSPGDAAAGWHITAMRTNHIRKSCTDNDLKRLLENLGPCPLAAVHSIFVNECVQSAQRC
mmetsp:Transcript_1553/g.2771  ORF Transcript_1553/g.2771 Transcript_1553/m.2771 type:complete len:97 (+) Transcript_1553:1942-2232(+)